MLCSITFQNDGERCLLNNLLPDYDRLRNLWMKRFNHTPILEGYGPTASQTLSGTAWPRRHDRDQPPRTAQRDQLRDVAGVAATGRGNQCPAGDARRDHSRGWGR